MKTASRPKAPSKVHIIATGGTIAGTYSDRGTDGYNPGSLSVQNLLKSVPQLSSFADVTAEQFCNIGSQDMTDNLWLSLHNRTLEILEHDPNLALIIVHGTDTMEETAWFLELVKSYPNPVIMVGAMRPSGAINADGPGNLLGGVIAATDADAWDRGVLVYSNNELHSARNVAKVNTVGIDGFGSLRRGMVGIVTGFQVSWMVPRRPTLPAFEVSNLCTLPRVDMVFAHASMTDDFLHCAQRNGAKGIVVAGLGGGNLPKIVISTLQSLVAKGMIVVRSSRIQGGFVARNIEIDDDSFGFVTSGELGAVKSRILTQLALTQTSDSKQIQRVFDLC